MDFYIYPIKTSFLTLNLRNGLGEPPSQSWWITNLPGTRFPGFTIYIHLWTLAVITLRFPRWFPKFAIYTGD